MPKRNEWGERFCPGCKQWLPDFEFYQCASSRDGLNWDCKTCVKRRRKTMNRHDPKRVERLNDQDGMCAICAKNIRDLAEGERAPHLDHDHTCCPGAVGRSCGECLRGMLCQSCNVGLGHFKESVENLEAAIAYLKFWDIIKNQEKVSA